MLEALLLAAAQSVAVPPDGKVTPPPSAELLEFLADWSQDEQELIDEVLPPQASRPAAGKPAPAKPAQPAKP